MKAEPPRRIGIIGGGVAGIVTARTLLDRGFDCTVFERGSRLGGVWAEGYANFGIQVQRELYEFPDWPFPPGTPDFTPGPIVRDYIEGYARHFGVLPRISFDSTVTGLRRDETGWILTVTTPDEAAEHRFDEVVICTGLFSNKPHIPSYPGREGFQGEVIHISELRDREQLRGRKVGVVGFGKSATDAALEAAAVAAETAIIVRTLHWPIPARLLDILPFKWAMLNRLTTTLIPLYYRTSTLERWVHGLGRPLVWAWWRIVEGLLIAQYGLGSRGGTRPSLIPSEPIEFDAFGETAMLPRSDFYRAVRGGEIAPLLTEISTFTPTGVVLRDGRSRNLDTVVLATGWESDHGFIADDVRAALDFQSDGLYLYRQILPPAVANLAFIGHASTISSVLTYTLQARWLADVMAGRCPRPPAAEMARNVAAQQERKRRTMPFSRGRGARLLLYMLHYHDELLEDLGVSPLRKTGIFAPFKEVFAPYQPSDYRAVVGPAKG